MPAERSFKVKVVASLAPKSVTVNGEKASYKYLAEDFAFVIDIPQTDCAAEKVIYIDYGTDNPFITDGIIGKSCRVSRAIEAMKFRFGNDAIDPLAKLQTINEAVYYEPEKAAELIEEFRTIYSELPDHITKQWWLQEADWYWFLKRCGWDK